MNDKAYSYTTLVKWVLVSLLFACGITSAANENAETHEHTDSHESASHEAPQQTPAPEKPKVNLSIMNTPCGLVDSLAGDVQFLDTDRSKFLNLTAKSVLPCGAWVSVNRGWVQLRHQNGPRIHMGNNTFIQIPDSRKDPKFKGDHAVLYKGEIFAQSNHEGEEFNIVTAGARARLKRGKIIVIFNLSEDETQLITLSNSATLENRFEPSRKMRVRAGEASSLNFELVRVLPLAPKAVSVATLKPKLVDLQINEADQLEALRVVAQRQERRFAAPLIAESDSHSEEFEHESEGKHHDSGSHHSPKKHSVPVAHRKLASASEDKGTYLQNPPSQDGPALTQHLVNRVVGGEKSGEKLFSPQLEDPSDKMNEKARKQEAFEKKNLIRELSKVRPE